MQIEQIEGFARDAVSAVFRSMLSLELIPDPPVSLDDDESGQIAGSVGLIGPAQGYVYLYAGVAFARILTARMLGMREDELDATEMVNDAFGELTNMVGGSVKSRLCDSGWSCTLTIPSLVRGRGLSIAGVSSVSRRVVGYRHGSQRLLVELLLKNLPQNQP